MTFKKVLTKVEFTWGNLITILETVTGTNTNDIIHFSGHLRNTHGLLNRRHDFSYFSDVL